MRRLADGDDRRVADVRIMLQLPLGIGIAHRHRLKMPSHRRHVIALRDRVVASEDGHGDEDSLHGDAFDIEPLPLDAAISTK